MFLENTRFFFQFFLDFLQADPGHQKKRATKAQAQNTSPNTRSQDCLASTKAAFVSHSLTQTPHTDTDTHTHIHTQTHIQSFLHSHTHTHTHAHTHTLQGIPCTALTSVLAATKKHLTSQYKSIDPHQIINRPQLRDQWGTMGTLQG